MSQTYDAVAENGQIILRCILRDPCAEINTIDIAYRFELEEGDAFRQSLHDAIETARSQRAETDRRALEKLYASRAALDEQIATIERRQARHG